MNLQSAQFSEVGPRFDNQDQILAPTALSDDTSVVAIADGVGGGPNGGRAAEIALEAVRTMSPDPQMVNQVFLRAGEEMRRLDIELERPGRMATTLSLALVTGNTVHVAHVGDTRIYHLRAGGINTLTIDQTEVAELERKGILTRRQAERHPRRNVLFSALSGRGDHVVFHGKATLQAGDRLLLVTDGVHAVVHRRDVAQLSARSKTVNEFISGLRAAVLTRGEVDNYSAIAIEFAL